MSAYRRGKKQMAPLVAFVDEDALIVRKPLATHLLVILMTVPVAAFALYLAWSGPFIWNGAPFAVLAAVLGVGAVSAALRVARIVRDLRERQKARYVSEVERTQIRTHRGVTVCFVTIDGRKDRIDETAFNRLQVGQSVLVERAVHSGAMLWLEPVANEADPLAGSLLADGKADE